MSIWAIADTHLSLGVDKPMDIFGDHWLDHTSQIRQAWLESIRPEDTVLIPGDISWGMTLAEARPDLEFLHALPGTVLIGKGNHDYWWSTLKKMEDFIEAHGLHSLRFQKNDAHVVELRDRRAIICGSRGWKLPGDPDFNAQDRKIYHRELQRLRLSLNAGIEHYRPGDLLICTLHYPPLSLDAQPTPISDLLEAYPVERCLFGHVHGIGWRTVFEGTTRGITYTNIASDHLGFQPRLIAE